MGALFKLRAYKDQLIETIVNQPSIISAITDEEEPSIPATNMIYKNIFPYAYIPETADEAKVFVCIEANVLNANTDAICDIELFVFVICHDSMMRTDFGTRVDAVADAIDDFLSHSEEYGIGKVTLNPRSPIVYTYPNYEFYGRKVSYFIPDFNFRNIKRN